jgi:hypothetical protein
VPAAALYSQWVKISLAIYLSNQRIGESIIRRSIPGLTLKNLEVDACSRVKKWFIQLSLADPAAEAVSLVGGGIFFPDVAFRNGQAIARIQNAVGSASIPVLPVVRMIQDSLRWHAVVSAQAED